LHIGIVFPCKTVLVLNNRDIAYIAIQAVNKEKKIRRRLYTQGRIDSATHPDGADEEVF